jgi:alternate signal-mediated exported protein
MNKFLKGSIAAAAGLVLLLGGAGTFALWSQSTTVADHAVASGNLTLASTGGAWNTNPALWVPGDSFTYTTTLTLTATGDNLKAWLTVDKGSIATSATPSVADTALAAALDVSLTVTPTAGVAATTTAGQYDVTPKAGTYSVPVTVTVTFPSAVAGTTAQGGTVNLHNIAFALNQHL